MRADDITTAWKRKARHALTLFAAVAGLGLVTWTVASALPTFAVDISPWTQPRSFSPNGDGQEDVASIQYCLTEPANVDITIADSTGAIVRTIESAVSHNGDPSCSGYNYAEWDGKTDNGAAVPDGSYTAHLHAVNAEGRTSDDTLPIAVDTRIPGTLSEPAPNSTLSGTVHWTFTPSGGFAASEVEVGCVGASLGFARTTDSDHMYSGSGDTAPCLPGDNRLTATVQWTDDFGSRHSWSAPAVPVVVDNPPQISVAPYAHRYFSPNGDSQEDTTDVPYCLSKAANVDVRVTDATGSTVRTVESGTPRSGYFRCPYYNTNTAWDGRDDAGQVVSDGVYTLHIHAVDSSGQSADASIEVGVDRRTPGALTAPVADEVLSGTVNWKFVPTDGLGVYEVSVWCAGSGGLGSSRTPGPDGAFTGTADSANCTAGANNLVSYAYWTDPFGVSHGWTPPPTPVTIDNPPQVSIHPYAHRYFSPNDDGQEDRVDLAFCLSKNAKVDIAVTDATNVQVRAVENQAERSGAIYCNWSHYSTWDGKDDAGNVVPAGVYTVRVRATDSSGHTGEATVEVGVDRQVPGILTAPAPNASLSGTVPWSFTKTQGYELTEVSVACRNAGLGYSRTPGEDGVFSGSADTTRCAVGSDYFTATTWWVDAFGQSHGWTTPPVPVTIDNAPQVFLHPQTHRYFSPNNDGQEDLLFAYYCLSGDATVDVAIVDGSGSVVRTLETAEPKHGSPNCYNWNNSAGWDGRTDAGTVVADGIYAFRVRATTASGRSGESMVDIGVDTRSPGTLVTPAPGATLAGLTRIVFQPTADFPITQINAWFDTGGQATIFNASADGLWRTSLLTRTLRDGPALLHTTVRHTDPFGVQHWWAPAPTPVAIDVTSLPLTVTADPASGPAPLATTLRIDTSDPQARPVHYVVNFGDGSPTMSGDLNAPYPTIEVPHTYSSPGVRRAIVTVTNSANAASTSAVDITATGRPNTAPNANLALDITTGTTPLVVNASVDGSDAEQDELTYSLSFGDGTAPVRGTLPNGPISHTYDVPGSFLVRLAISDGRQTAIRTATVVSALSEPHTANAGDDQRVTTHDQVTFTGRASRPSAAISAYHWEFGDGATADGLDATHSYSSPGEYTARLTTKIGTDTSTDTTKITVQAPPAEQGLIVRVSGGGGALPGAQALIVRPDGSRLSATTDSTGKAVLTNVDNGSTTVYVWAAGHRPQAATTTVSDGRGEVSVTLTAGDVGAATLEQRRLTYEEIVEKGIDVADPQNSHVYEASIHLFFTPEETPTPEREISVYVTPERIICADECGYPTGGDPGGGESCQCFNVGGYQYLPQVTYVQGEPVIQWLVLPMRASFLKEFFDVKLIVQNLTGAFTFERGVADLQLPSGLSLAPTPVPQSLSQTVDPVPGGQSRTVSWVVRGDVEGSYPLAASYSGSVEPIGEPVYLRARSQSDVKVWGASALRTRILVDPTIQRWGPYAVDVEITNVSDVPVYNMQVEMFDRPADAPDEQALFFYAPGLDQVQGTGSIAPGGTWTASYVVFAGVGNEEVTKLRTQLGHSFVRRTGGDVDLNPTLGFREGAPGGSPPQYEINMDVHQRDEVDYADLDWTVPEVAGGVHVTGYELRTRQSLRGGIWTRYGEQDLDRAAASISSTDRMIGRYYGVVTKLSNGTKEFRHHVGVGPSRYVSLGDSYSSGEGVPAFEPGTASDVDGNGGNKCHRSYGSYGRLLLADKSIPALLEPATFAACSGAVTRDFEFSQPDTGEKNQLSHVNQFTDLITLSLGGNDAGFRDIATLCVVVDCKAMLAAYDFIGSNGFLDTAASMWNYASWANCVNPSDLPAKAMCGYKIYKTITSIEEVLDPQRVATPRNVYNGTLRERLTRIYDQLLKKAPNAQILVQPYPRLVDTANHDSHCYLLGVELPITLSGSERDAVSSLSDKLNAEISAAVKAFEGKPIRIVGVQSKFAGHELCRDGTLNPGTYFNSVVNPYLSVPGNFGPIMYSFHPNAAGQQAYKDAVADVLKQDLSRVLTVPPRAEVDAGSVFVPHGGRTVRATAAWPGSTVTLKLISPNGIEFTTNTLGVRSGGTSTSRWIEVPNPAQGSWRVKLFGDDVDPAGEPTQVSAYAEVPPPTPPSAQPVSRPVDGTPGAFDLSVSDANGAYTYQWTFSDGTTAHGTTVRHLFTNNGMRWATLQVTDGAGENGWFGLDLGPAPATPTSVTLQSSGATAVYGDGLTFSAAVTSTSATPAGTVTFSRDGSALTGCTDLPLTDGVSTCATSMLPVGTHTITASFQGSPEFGSATATLAQRVDPAVLKVDARDVNKPYGAETPPLAYDINGFVNGDDKNVVTGTTTCILSAPTNAGEYAGAISCGTNGLSALNYTFTAGRAGTFTITKAQLTINADNASTTYGDPPPPLTARLTGFVAGETGPVTGTAQCTTTATAASPAGTYPITCAQGTLAAPNYTFANGANGSLVVARRVATLAYTGPTSVSTGSASTARVDLRAQLAVSSGGTPDLTKASVVFRLYRSTNTTMDPAAPDLRCEATPSATGTATCTITNVAIDNWTVIASVPAANGYFASSDSDPAVLSACFRATEVV